MPRIVNHDDRRREIVDAFLRITERDGLHATTSRAIAAELGVATGALWHYFDNFDAVFTAAFMAVYNRTSARITARTQGLDGLDALRAMVAEILPVSEQAQTEAGIVVAFWGRAAASPVLARHQADAESAWRVRLVEYLESARDQEVLRADVPVEETADVISSICLGQQVEFVVRSPLGDPGRQVALVDAVLSPWLR